MKKRILLILCTALLLFYAFPATPISAASNSIITDSFESSQTVTRENVNPLGGKIGTLNYDANGGSGAPSSQTFALYDGVTLSSIVPTRSGCAFLGWSTDPYATSAEYQPGELALRFAGDITLYAVWGYSTYTVTITEKRDGTATVKITLPASIGIRNGKIVYSVSDALTYIADSAYSPINAVINADAETVTCTFAADEKYAHDAVVIEATYLISQGAIINATDVVVSEWEIGDGDNVFASQNDSDVISVFVEPLIGDETVTVKSTALMQLGFSNMPQGYCR